ncbi:hypothetical protein Tco_0218654 [Tanacetum coccineum]
MHFLILRLSRFSLNWSTGTAEEQGEELSLRMLHDNLETIVTGRDLDSPNVQTIENKTVQVSEQAGRGVTTITTRDNNYSRDNNRNSGGSLDADLNGDRAGHLQRDWQKNTGLSSSGQADKSQTIRRVVFALTSIRPPIYQHSVPMIDFVQFPRRAYIGDILRPGIYFIMVPYWKIYEDHFPLKSTYLTIRMLTYFRKNFQEYLLFRDKRVEGDPYSVVGARFYSPECIAMGVLPFSVLTRKGRRLNDRQQLYANVFPSAILDEKGGHFLYLGHIVSAKEILWNPGEGGFQIYSDTLSKKGSMGCVLMQAWEIFMTPTFISVSSGKANVVAGLLLSSEVGYDMLVQGGEKGIFVTIDVCISNYLFVGTEWFLAILRDWSLTNFHSQNKTRAQRMDEEIWANNLDIDQQTKVSRCERGHFMAGY